MAADSTVAMHDDADCHSPAAKRRPVSDVGIADGDQVAEAQTAQSIALPSRTVGQLDVIVPPPGGVLPQPGSHQLRGDEVRDRYLQLSIPFQQAPTSQQAGSTIEHLDERIAQQPQSLSERPDLYPVPDSQPLENVGGEVGQYMVDASMLACHQANAARARPADDARLVAHAGVGDERIVGSVARSHDLALIIM